MACNTLRITLYTYTLNDKISLSMILYAVYASSYNKYVHPKRDICDVYIYINMDRYRPRYTHIKYTVYTVSTASQV